MAGERSFLLIRLEIHDPRFSTTIAIFDSDNSEEGYYMLTFDERDVSRKYEVTLRDNIWKWWRNAPGFFQRYEGAIVDSVDSGNTIIGKGELSKDGLSWEKDLEITYRQIEYTESRNM
jgi:hypothetical protein